MFKLYEIECERSDWGHIAIAYISYSLYDSDVKWNIKCQICSAFISVHSSVKIDESRMKEKETLEKCKLSCNMNISLFQKKREKNK